MKKNSVPVLLIFSLLVLSAGCQFNLNEVTSTPEATATSTVSQTTAVPVPEETATPASQTLVLWLPPMFDPQADTEAGKLFNQRLRDFEALNPTVRIQVRIKAETGPAGLMDSLANTSAAAPLALPSLIALPRTDLETAALKGWVYPLGEISSVMDEEDWFDYARSMSDVQNTHFGVPFAGDVLLLVHRGEKINPSPTSWEAVFTTGLPVLFPAADSSGIVTMDLYLSLGGQVQDSQHKPVLDESALLEVLRLFAEGSRQGVFPYWLSQYENDNAAWDSFDIQQTYWIITWASSYLSRQPENTQIMPLPSLGQEPYALGRGWSWAIADSDPERRQVSARLAEYLANPEYLAKWSMAAGFLPVRPSSASQWQDADLGLTLSELAQTAIMPPANDLFNSIGPVLQAATLKVIKQQVSPIDAAAEAAKQFVSP